MKCPECSSLFGDELRGKQHCNECNTPLTVIALPDTPAYLTVWSVSKVRLYKSEADTKADSKRAATVKRIYILDNDASPDLSLRCFHCSTVISKMIAVRGNIIVGWKAVEVVSKLSGQLEDKQIPQFKEVHACTRCLGELNEVLPDKAVTPVRDDKNGVTRHIKDVTHDVPRADDHDSEPCTTFVDWSGRVWNQRSRQYEDLNNVCLYCRRNESAHSIREVSRKVYAESFNR